MNRLKRYTLAGIFFVSVIGTLSHFLYQLSGNSFLVGLFAPVGESTWEHIKLLFFPMLFYSLWMSVRLRKEEPGVISALAVGNLAGCALIPTIFYTFHYDILCRHKWKFSHYTLFYHFWINY